MSLHEIFFDGYAFCPKGEITESLESCLHTNADKANLTNNDCYPFLKFFCFIFADDIKVSVNDFIIKAAAVTLRVSK